MATVTPNFNWPVPTSTDLVKDGATAIEALGDSIDASLVDLKGGTSGQVLSKNSNTDMDFVWVTSDDANAIQNSIVDAKGDLISATANDTPARLAVGANGETLVADSSTSTGLRYTAGNVSDNPVLNSAMQVWQRGTSFALAAATITYTADRWYGYRGGGTGLTISRQTTSDTTNLPFIQYCLRMQRDSGNTSTARLQFGQSWESINSIPFAGKTVTFSFYARRGANYSGGSVDAVLLSGTGTDQNQINGFTGGANVAVASSALSTTWTRYSATGTVATNATQLATYFQYDPTGTAGAADFIEVTGVQVDVGSVALPYRSTTGTIQGELAACQRYLPAIYGGSYAGYAYATNSILYAIPFPVNARVAPTGITVTGTWTGYSLNSGSNFTPTFNLADKSGASIDSSGGRTITAGQGSRLESSGGVILFTGCEL
jgi:hypothetical protein